MDELDYTPDPGLEPHLDALRAMLVERVWSGIFLAAIVAVPVTLTRAYFTGWVPSYAIYLAAGTLFSILHVFSARLSWQAKHGVVQGLLWLVGVASLLTFGILGTGILWLLASVLLVGMLYPLRSAQALALAALVATGGIAWGWTSGTLRAAFDANRFIHQPSAWTTLIFTAFLMALAVMIALSAFREAIEALLAEVLRQREEVARQQTFIEHQATHDPLTELPNLPLAMDRLEMAIHQARRDQCKAGLLYLDLDGFRQATDQHGHEAADFLLQEVAIRLRQMIRATDTAGRVSGDEFLVVLGSLHDDQAMEEVAKKLISFISRPVFFQGKELSVSCSIGMALYPDHGQVAGALKAAADKAMQDVKRAGKNNCAFASAEAE